MPKFTIEEHERKMREILTPKPEEGEMPAVLQKLLDKARLKREVRPGEVEPEL